ncbi:tRNA lysidine(34) synthetase TilS [Actinomadura rudentiformis]|uniref:tRNA(Ile)-lysidine synthase n=1 Tax=Actinomadura rudentiformis TaxID=359158 RepID=A0A6H9YZK8_9ACTN|nr:tRNA lysidine(34) synthetase TilS [Actinomadura rudentiformis]KAB2350827.1 tRNA lysidine(34) synthetase TilS [Actinomadura rudentiformis]
MGPDPAVAAVRVAVRQALDAVPPGALVLVACSGGADSLALAAALAFEAPRHGRRAGGVTIDHGLQQGSDERAARLVRTMADLGLDPAGSVAVTVGREGGPENAAREARYAALDKSAARLGAAAVLLGHTRDDQAETVLLGLARGSGARSLAGMPSAFERPSGVRYLRPLLETERATTRRACEALGLEPWDDPHNEDPSYKRVRVRNEALPVLEKTLGPGVADALARTARMLRDDADALESLAERAYQDLLTAQDPQATTQRAAEPSAEPSAPPSADPSAPLSAELLAVEGLPVEGLAELPRALRTRVLRMAAIEAGSPPGTLAAVHVDAVDRLVTAWHGQQHVDLPAGVRAFRRYGKLLFGTGLPPRRVQQ